MVYCFFHGKQLLKYTAVRQNANFRNRVQGGTVKLLELLRKMATPTMPIKPYEKAKLYLFLPTLFKTIL